MNDLKPNEPKRVPRQCTMTFKEIIVNEDGNSNCVYLHRKGVFMKAYNHSAFLFHRYIRSDFKLSCRLIAKENRYLVSLGMPAGSEKAYKSKWVVEELFDGAMVRIVLPYKVDEAEYADWEEASMVRLPPAQRYTRITGLIEKQPVYKMAYDNLMSVLDVCASVDKRFMEPAGSEARKLAYDIALGVRLFYGAEDRAAEQRRLDLLSQSLSFALQVLNDKRQLSDDRFAECAERLESVREQLKALVKTSSKAQ